MEEDDVLKVLYNLLMEIKDRPGMYLGKKSLSKLRTYIDGFLMGAQKFVGGKRYYEFFSGFQEWIEHRYNIELTHHWSSIILFYSMNHEETALECFYELLDEFLRNKNIQYR